MQELLFEVGKADLELLFFFEELCLLLFQFRLLEVDGDREELTFEAALRHGEIDYVN